MFLWHRPKKELVTCGDPSSFFSLSQSCSATGSDCGVSLNGNCQRGSYVCSQILTWLLSLWMQGSAPRVMASIVNEVSVL